MARDISPNDQAQKQFFDANQVPLNRFEQQIKIGDKDYQWAVLDSEDGVVD